jgi:DNA polymerase-3 subunit beta
MKLSIEKGELQKGLARIQSIVEKRNTMPILANVLLRAAKTKGKAAAQRAKGERSREGGGDDSLELAATDLEVGVRGSHTADVQTAGEITVSAKKIFEIVRELPEETVHLEDSSGYLVLRCARSEFTLAATSAEEYPSLPTVAPDKMAVVQAAVLGDMIARTMYAASMDETRYNLNGVYLEQRAEEGKLRMVATDGHRLAYVDRELGGELAGLGNGVIIPRKALAELKRLVDEDDADEVEIGFEGNSGLVRKGDVTLVIRLIEGEFPNYHQVVPEQTTRHLSVSCETLNHALRRVALLSAERSRAVKLELSEGLLSLSANNPDMGEAKEEVDVDYAGEGLSIAFNARYLLDALSAMGTKEVTLGFQDDLSPARLVPSNDEDTLAVVMPMRV